MYLLRLQELFDSVQAEFAAMATLLISSPGGFDIARLHRVHPNDPGAQGFHHPQATEDVARPNGRCQSVGCIVGDLESIVFVLERHAVHNRTEDFLSRDSSLII